MRAKKSLGQNFLHDAHFIGRIVTALDLGPDDTVVEIGPGTGAITRELLRHAGHVVAIEFDRDLIGPLKAQFRGSENLKLINANALSISFVETVGSPGAKLVANLPYNISTQILKQLTEERHIFSQMVLMFQREVVQRITAKPGGSDRGFLSVIVENAFDTTSLFDVPPTAFHPVPKVWSSVVRLVPRQSIAKDEVFLRALASASFAQKRKTLANNLKGRFRDAEGALARASIDGRRRAETLTLDEWVALAGELSGPGIEADSMA